MSVWALSDPHLAFGVPSKTMESFGESWKNYAERIAEQWKERVALEDLVLIPGDISWAMHLAEALIDLRWIDLLPGKKVILKGNHDHWWGSLSKLQTVLPSSIQALQNNSVTFIGKGGEKIAIGGSRLWDTPEYTFHPFIDFKENLLARQKNAEELAQEEENAQKIFNRELERLRLSLQQLDPRATTRIAITHYPPVGADLSPSRASAILEEFKIDYCIFGHLHNVKLGSLPFGSARGVRYIFASCDYIHFCPILVK